MFSHKSPKCQKENASTFIKGIPVINHAKNFKYSLFADDVAKICKDSIDKNDDGSFYYEKLVPPLHQLPK